MTFKVRHYPNHRAVEFRASGESWKVDDDGTVRMWDDIAGHYVYPPSDMPATRVTWVRGRGLSALRRDA